MYWVVDTTPPWIFYPTPTIRRNLDIITADFEPMPLEEKTSVQTTPDYVQYLLKKDWWASFFFMAFDTR